MKKKKLIKSFKKFFDEPDTIFNGPGEKEAYQNAKLIKAIQKPQPGVDKAPPIGINGGPNYTNRSPAPKNSRGFRKSKV